MLQIRRRLDLGQEPLGTDDGCDFRLQDLERDLPLVLGATLRKSETGGRCLPEESRETRKSRES